MRLYVHICRILYWSVRAVTKIVNTRLAARVNACQRHSGWGCTLHMAHRSVDRENPATIARGIESHFCRYKRALAGVLAISIDIQRNILIS